MWLLKRNKAWIGVINCTNYWIWTRKSCRRRIILIAVNSGITFLEIRSGRTVCWHLREGRTERANYRIQGLCIKMPPPIVWLQNVKRKEHFSESLHGIRKEKYKLRKINPGDNHLKNYQVWKWQKIIPMNFNLITVSGYKKSLREKTAVGCRKTEKLRGTVPVSGVWRFTFSKPGSSTPFSKKTRNSCYMYIIISGWKSLLGLLVYFPRSRVE